MLTLFAASVCTFTHQRPTSSSYVIMCLTLVSHALACTRVSGQTLQACLYPDLKEKKSGKKRRCQRLIWTSLTLRCEDRQWQPLLIMTLGNPAIFGSPGFLHGVRSLERNSFVFSSKQDDRHCIQHGLTDFLFFQLIKITWELVEVFYEGTKCIPSLPVCITQPRANGSDYPE
ncbi:hypothetical protein F4820DRAFT_229243 [Hypoxylon rubiginosum]|uniref:Uncharacterized protein n=1 Tax=Hypoxylon rubiginosum TaxID=110542 RepID=A0ACB9Z6X1_9PEZI|nr:hypothetical protein F4820DRAFT_229243 [Hypoxylon rubiginosum]